jgi:hypothetical protein
MTGFRNFPTPKNANKGMKECCKDKNNIKEWDCACSWGCEHCWIKYTCKVCHHSFSSKFMKETKDEKDITKNSL